MKSAALALLLALPAGEPSAAEQVARLLAAKPEERAAVVAEIVAAKPDPEAIAAALVAGRAYSADAPRGWLERTVTAPDGKSRPYLLHVPAKYDPAKRYRMVIDMHGGVNRPKPLTHAELGAMKWAWGTEAEEREWILALPAGDATATWWDGNGAGMVLRILREVKETWNVDDDAVFATGFSDGGSGAYHLAAARATPFAGFIALNGHPGVAGMGGVPMFLRNLVNRPMYAVHTDRDPLYPSATMKPILDALAGLGAPLVWREIRGFGHEPAYLPAEKPAILEWMDGVRRPAAPKVVWWEGVQGAPGRVDWIEVTTLAGGSGKEPFPDVNPMIRPTNVRLGVQMDETFAGPGARVVAVVDGSLARGMDVRTGDVLLAVDGVDLATAEALRAVLAKKAPGQEIALRLRRGEDVLEKTTKIPEVAARPAFPRDLPWGTLRAEAKGNRIDVTCRGIAAFEVLVSPALLDMGKPVEVVVNGTPAWSGSVATDLRFLLERAAEDGDRGRVVRARIPVKVPAPGK